MVRHDGQDLDSLVTAFGRDPFPEVHNGLNPQFAGGEFVFSAFGQENSKRFLAIKDNEKRHHRSSDYCDKHN